MPAPAAPPLRAFVAVPLVALPYLLRVRRRHTVPTAHRCATPPRKASVNAGQAKVSHSRTLRPRRRSTGPCKCPRCVQMSGNDSERRKHVLKVRPTHLMYPGLRKRGHLLDPQTLHMRTECAHSGSKGIDARNSRPEYIQRRRLRLAHDALDHSTTNV